MRQVIVSNIMSVDGYYEGPGRNVMALNVDEAFDAYNLERIRAAGMVVLAVPSDNPRYQVTGDQASECHEVAIGIEGAW